MALSLPLISMFIYRFHDRSRNWDISGRNLLGGFVTDSNIYVYLQVP